MKRLDVLDALRFVFAFLVVLGHTGPIPLAGQAPAWGWSLIFTAAPVVGFFVISGFCIHTAFVNHADEPFPVGRFYARRYLRIALPVLGVLALTKVIDNQADLFGRGSLLWYSALWSVACEEIYYFLYPLLNRARNRFGWIPLLGPTLLLSVALAAYSWSRDHSFAGIVATTLILFPVWLLGCVLAELVSSSPTHSAMSQGADRFLGSSFSTRQIWVLRLVAYLTNVAEGLLAHYTSFLAPQTYLVAGLILFVWIRAEILYSRGRPPKRRLVSGGQWSYSLYLVHPVILWTWLGAATFNRPVSWLWGLALIISGSYVFFLVIERPAHRLARRIRLFPTGESQATVGAAA